MIGMQPGTEFGDYLIGEKIGESLQAEVYKAFHKFNLHVPLTLKVLKPHSSAVEQTQYLRQKIERLQVLHDPRMGIPLLLESCDNTPFIIQPWISGITLNKWLEGRLPLDIRTFFTLACALADILHMVHDAGIVHGGIKPHNILIQPSTLSVWLTDFVTPLDIRDVSHFIYDTGFVRDTLAYTSPEQSGRINHRVDFSTDLYSLGIIFYELLTGQLPYFSSDPLELIHLHLSEEATLASDLNPQVPHILAKIVAKLTLKEPEKRYQSSHGLLADLNHCLAEFTVNGGSVDFHLGSTDQMPRTVFISRMVGRNHEARIILDQYDYVVKGQFRSLFISGLSGVGKTRLIQELQKPLVKHCGYFTSGKFDQYQKNIPYSSLIQALRHLMRTFLTESDQQVAQWQARILKALISNGRVITDVLPELEFIIGSQPEVAHLPPVEARNRFNSVFGSFLASLICENNPLILFIDDLQWCDTATFEFLQYIFANSEDYPYLFFMGAYRNNEVDSTHPLAKLLQAIRQNNESVKEIYLTELDQGSVHEMVAYILDASLEETKSLAHFINELTEGNPLFVSESLSYLYKECLLYLDNRQHWCWDIVRIRDSQMPTTVVDMFSSKVRKLPAETLMVLEYCACMGNRFTPQELSLILNIDLSRLFETLKPVLNLGMLLENKVDLQFVHDRVQEAVLRIIEPQLRIAIHWRIGNRLLENTQKKEVIEKSDKLFTIASHLNRGRPNKITADIAKMLADINFYAGNKAMESLATDAANEFFRFAYALLQPDCWREDYTASFRILQRLAKTELMCGRYEESEILIDCLVEHAATDMDKAEALAEQTTSLSSVGNFNTAIATANRGLDFFGKAIPSNDNEARQRMQELMTRVAEQGDVWHKILHMPFSSDNHSKIELAFYSELIPDLYMSGMVPQLYLAAAQSTQHCLEGGMDESVIYSFSIMGLNLGEQGLFDQAFRYQDLAHELCTRYPNTFGATRGMNGIVWCNMHSRSHPAEIVDYCHKTIQCGKNCGDLYNAGLSYGPLMWNLQLQGQDLQKVDEAAQECLQFSRKNHLSFSVGMADAVLAGWVHPMNAKALPTDMTEKLAQWQADNHVATSGSYFVLLGIAQYFIGEYEQAEITLNEVNRYLNGLTDNVLKRQWIVFNILNYLRLSRLRNPGQVLESLPADIEEQLKQVRVWSQLGPLLKPYFTLLLAEIALASDERREARNLYLDASELAHASRYIMLEAYLYQCLAELKERTSLGNPGMLYREALRLYQLCNANRLSQQLISQHALYLQAEPEVTIEPLDSQQSISILSYLNLSYLMQSVLDISVETDFDKVLSKIISTVLESSGAQHGYLLIKEHDTLVLQAECHVSDSNERNIAQCVNSNQLNIITQPHCLEKGNELCLAIVNFVYRTGEKVILANASEEGLFTNAHEVQSLALRSVLCLPVMTQGNVIGILYLEDRLTEGVFTQDKVNMTEMLAAHAAISLENVHLLLDTKRNEEKLRTLNETLEQRVQEELNKNREKDILMIQQSRLAAMGEMIGNIAHQWRQPLNALALVLSNIKDAYQFNELDADYINQAEANGKRLIQKMTTTINDFRDFFKTDKKEVNFSAYAQIHEAIALVDAAFKHNHIEITLEVLQDIQLCGFPNEYSQVLLNLLSNAKDAILAHTETGSVIIRLYQKDNYGCVAVEDNGGGVPELVMSKIFEPYFSTKSMGSGIGLYMSKMIIEHHMKGFLIVENTQYGAVFTVCTPLAEECL
jgi:predicted ATPase/signal transduction histidine kinase